MKNIISRIFIGLLIFVCFFMSCKKEEKNTIETSTITYIDGNNNTTVKIGKQWWMAENLRVKRYRNGDSIIQISQSDYQIDSSEWNHLDSGAYCIIESNGQSSVNYQGKTFGFLYNGYSVLDTRNIAPVGWHVPSDEDWKELEKYLGMNDTELDKMSWRGNSEGDKLKINGKYNGWHQPTDVYYVWGTNESGFTALGGGCCMYNGVWGSPNIYYTGFWWSTTSNNEKLLYRYLDYNKPNIFRYYGSKHYGFSIRCVKDY